jgi:hypothetical protein
MKALIGLLMVLGLAVPAMADGGFEKEHFSKVIYLAYGGSASNSGLNPASPKPFVDGDLWAIPANVVIEKVYLVVDSAITGTTDLDVGDDDNQDGFVDGSLSATLGTPGMYGWDVKNAGAYLRVETAGATDALDIFVVPNAKFYSATGKEVKLDVTTTNTAGRARVVIEGYYLGARNQ